MKRIPALLLAVLLLKTFTGLSQSSIIISKKRPAQLDISGYKKVAIGDFVGSSGMKTARSMDLSDALTSRLFNSDTYEIIDRNALEDLVRPGHGASIPMINETTITDLGKKINSAVIIVGRIQNEKIYKEQKSQNPIIVVNGCRTTYYWSITGDITVQIKIIDVKTGKMLFSSPVSTKINVQTKADCEPRSLGDIDPLLKDAVTNLASEITKIFLPYEDKMMMVFEKPLIIGKNPFNKLDDAIRDFSTNQNKAALDILKACAENNSLKDKFKEKAIYNYGVGLFIDEQYESAAEQFKLAGSLDCSNAAGMLALIETEKQYKNRLVPKAAKPF